jgi:hypothetical protein
MLSAKNVGVKWTDFPQSWLLEPETSETEKTIRKLQTQLEQARKAGPVLGLRCTDKAGEPVNRLDASVTRYMPLTCNEIEKLLRLVKQRRPMATDFGPRDAAERNAGGNSLMAIFGDQEVFTPATDAEIRRYRNEDYPGWLTSIETFLQEMHTIAAQIDEPPLLIFEAENNGTKPAQDSLVVIKAKGALLVTPPPNDDPEETDVRCISPRTYFKDGLKLRAPPEPPAGKWAKRNPFLNDLISGTGINDYAEQQCRERGIRKPETFDFLGFTHCCGRRRNDGGFKIVRLTIKKRMRTTLEAIRGTLMRRRHEPVAVVGRWLRQVLQGYLNYHAVPGNLRRLGGFRWEVGRAWRHALMRRSQRNRLSWERFQRLLRKYLPPCRLLHPHPDARLTVKTPAFSRTFVSNRSMVAALILSNCART